MTFKPRYVLETIYLNQAGQEIFRQPELALIRFTNFSYEPSSKFGCLANIKNLEGMVS